MCALTVTLLLLLLLLLLAPQVEGQAWPQLHLQGPGSTAAEGCESLKACTSERAGLQAQHLQPWQVGPHCWPCILK
jgi:hypothetical protein